MTLILDLPVIDDEQVTQPVVHEEKTYELVNKDIPNTLINKHNKVLYAVPYQHFTNAIENFFSVFKSRLQKKVGITYSELKENIKDTLKSIQSEIFKRIFKGSYERDEKYKRKSSKRSRRKSKQYKE